MATLVVRDWPDDIHTRLKVEAVRRGVSLREVLLKAVRLWMSGQALATKGPAAVDLIHALRAPQDKDARDVVIGVLRRTFRMSQEDIAKAAGLDRASVSRILRGKQRKGNRP